MWAPVKDLLMGLPTVSVLAKAMAEGLEKTMAKVLAGELELVLWERDSEQDWLA